MLLQEPVQSAVWDALNHYSYADASFLAERLYAEVQSDDALFLLATSYYRSGKVARAYSLLKTHGHRSPECKFLLAKCCVDTKRLYEAESVLSVNLFAKSKSHEEIVSEFGTSSSHIFSMLGYIYGKTERHGKARECFKRGLKLNPLLWDAYVRLCDMGENVDPDEIFQTSETPSQTCDNKPSLTVPNPTTLAGTPEVTTPVADCLNETPTNVIPSLSLIPPSAPKTRRSKPTMVPSSNTFTLSSSSPLSPSFGVLPLDTPSPANEPPLPMCPLITPSPTSFFEVSDAIRAPNKRPTTRRGQNQNHNPIIHKPPVFSQSGTNLKDIPSPLPVVAMNTNVANVRRSSRLFSNSLNSSVKENNKTQARMKFSSPKFAGRKVKSQFIKTPTENTTESVKESVVSMNAANMEASTQAQINMLQRQSWAGILRLMKILGKAQLALTQYRCTDAIQCLSELTLHQYNTAWVLGLVAKAHFEINDYQKAVEIFEQVRLLEPYSLDGMETFSTCLWHLQRDVQLSALARDLTEFDQMSPEVWCATGNCFSLQKEHDTAIKFLKRAIQIAPDFCYAYTLLGHEYVFTEELDKALAAFRNALRCNPRHYNALYGVGMIYYKQEQYGFAEFHFRKALSINPESSVLLCHIAVVQHALQKSDHALLTLDRAIATDPRNPLCKFHRATILFASDRNTEALKELEELKQIVPKESLIYFLIGKVHKKLGNTHLALMNFSWAMDLDPKGANNQIKEAIDKRYVTEDDGDVTSHLDDPGLDGSAAAEPVAGEMVDASNNSSVLGDADMQLQAMESDDSL